MRPERHQELGPQEGELAIEVRSTDTRRAGIETVRRRTALEHVEDPVVGGREPQPGDGRVESPTGAADERKALPILLRAGGLADEHDAGDETAPVDDGVGPERTEGATAAGADLLRQHFPRGAGPGPDGATPSGPRAVEADAGGIYRGSHRCERVDLGVTGAARGTELK